MVVSQLAVAWKKKSRWQTLNTGAWVLAGIVFLGGGLLSLLLPFLDSVDVRPVRCTIESATPSTASGGFGGRATTTDVKVVPSDCRSALISQGLGYPSVQQVTDSFVRGTVYEFDGGCLSRVVAMPLGIMPNVRGFRAVH